MTSVLLTGFEPFGGERVNPSWQAVSLLTGRRHDTVAVELPCVFSRSLVTLRDAIDEYRPDLVICVGQAGGRADVTPERVAINLIDARIPDNAGSQPVDVPVIPGGPNAYFTTLPVKASVAGIKNAGLPASVSHTAGTYVCNQVFYGLMHLLDNDFPGVRGGFVHIPYTPEQAARTTAPSLATHRAAEALEIIVDTALTVTEDLSTPAGSLH
ncbi:pyroglutamyl-peptidase I [Amycolatopsis azurea]|uniref:Pyrrolidone-carboxylate peptidase n=1 Tax=Amycolatopsis azurea DSM 43854 TaxID=1238180 RepID=M2QA54_9PSEU|nr:pyroglutamyl-peptidase I [Amycolatopsis azurea]EMD23566.1 Pyrrolidone-carboxylate peptidase [Amycolatopsis azurea DSM 43854]OOC08464.1 pyroglutamyl-peptidase I [Amycolatopsis azurea DSM 43854]